MMGTGYIKHSGLQQSGRPRIRVSVGDEKWSDSETGKVIDGHNAAVFIYFLRQNAKNNLRNSYTSKNITSSDYHLLLVAALK